MPAQLPRLPKQPFESTLALHDHFSFETFFSCACKSATLLAKHQGWHLLQFDITILPPFPLLLCWFALRLASDWFQKPSQGIKTFLGPNLLIYSFSSSALLAHNVDRWACITMHYVFIRSQRIFLTKELYKHDARRISARYTSLQKGCCTVDRHVC